jgi:hypothetical protein
MLFVAIPLYLYSEHLTKKALEGFRDFKMGWKVVRTVQYADDLVLLGKEETMLQNMTDSLIEKRKML